MKARIYKPARTAMQQGMRKTHRWLLEFEPASARRQDPLMGWTSSDDTLAQVKLFFPEKDDAIAYAEKHGIPYEVREPAQHETQPKSYADNFRWQRVR